MYRLKTNAFAIVIWVFAVAVLAITLAINPGDQWLNWLCISLMVGITGWFITQILSSFKTQLQQYEHEYKLNQYFEYLRKGGTLTYLGWLNNQGKHIGK